MGSWLKVELFLRQYSIVGIGPQIMAAKIPVTVISGFLGSGKTTLIRHLLQEADGQRLAVLVNEFGELGIDGELIASCDACPEENVVELANGCLCCTVQEEFLPTMLQLLERREVSRSYCDRNLRLSPAQAIGDCIPLARNSSRRHC